MTKLHNSNVAILKFDRLYVNFLGKAVAIAHIAVIVGLFLITSSSIYLIALAVELIKLLHEFLKKF